MCRALNRVFIRNKCIYLFTFGDGLYLVRLVRGERQDLLQHRYEAAALVSGRQRQKLHIVTLHWHNHHLFIINNPPNYARDRPLFGETLRAGSRSHMTWIPGNPIRQTFCRTLLDYGFFRITEYCQDSKIRIIKKMSTS